jgi:hypothetical protein
MNNLPFKQIDLGNNQYLREFSENVDSDELEWHRDREDRIIEVIENKDWLFQIDNKLPVLLENQLFIPKETYHRVIKGTGKLIIKLTKLNIVS